MFGALPMIELGLPYLTFVLLVLGASCLTPATIYGMRQAELEQKFKQLLGEQSEAIRAKLKAWYQSWRERENKVLRDAGRKADELCDLIPDVPWEEFRGFIRQVANNFLPELYTQAQELRDEVAQVGEIIAEYKDKKLDDFSRGLLGKSVADKQELEKALAEIEIQITACRSFLDHIKSDLLVARRRGTGLPELRARFEQLTQGVEATSREVVKARQEVDDIGDRRVVNLPSHPRQRTPQ
ncbi:MAG: hypothetical protein ABIH67_01010 [Candidatus Uhrbacteria bacterium]